MHRNEAISEISKKRMLELTRQSREDILLSWWSIDENDIEFHELPLELQSEVLSCDNPPENVMDVKYDPLIMEALRYKLIGVTNEYLSIELLQLFGESIIVNGEPEELCECPCCGYKTLSFRGYCVCPVCSWEDDGNDERSLDRYSSPNHMTLREARDNFSKTAITPMLAKGVIVEKYYR